MSNRPLVVALAAVAFCGALAQLAVAPLLTAIAVDLDVSPAVVGQAVTITFAVGALLGLIAGPMGDHYGHRRMLIAGSMLATMSLFASAIAPDYSAFLLSRIPAGLGGAMMAASAIVIVSTRLPPETRRRAIGWVMTAYAIVPIIGFPAMTQIGHLANWRGSMLMLGLITLLLMTVATLVIKADGEWPSRRFAVRDTLRAYVPILQDGGALALQLSNFLRTVAGFSVVTYLSAYLMDLHGASLTTVGYVFLVAGAGYFIGTRLGDGSMVPMTLRNFQACSTALFGLAFAIPLIFSLGTIPTAILLTIGSIGLSAGFVTLIILISEQSPGGVATSLMLRQSGFAAGNAAAGAVGGLILTMSSFAVLGVGVLVLALISGAIGQWQPGHKPAPAPQGP